MAPEPALSSNGHSYSEIVIVTPALAAEWLLKNTHNRIPKQAAINAYAADMAAGRWQLTGESIKFSRHRVLLDGQNRCLACVKAMATFRTWVTYDLEPEVQRSMDTGVKRTPGDHLRLKGERNSSLLSSLAKMILTDGSRDTRNPTISEIEELVDREPFLRELCAEIFPTIRTQVVTDSVLAYTYYRLHQVDPDRCAAFFDGLYSLAGLPAGSPILALHKRMSSDRNGNRSRRYRAETVALIFSAWNAWINGETRTMIKLVYGENGRLVTPEPRPPRRRS